MADLSKMLGDVYGEAKSKPAQAPEWSDDARLDEAFSGWTPGPSDDASAAERRFFGNRPDDGAAPLADDLATALSEAVLAESTDVDVAHPEVAAEPEVDVEPEVKPEPYKPQTKAFDFSEISGTDNSKDIAVLRHDPEVEKKLEPAVAVAQAPAFDVEPEPTPVATPVASGPWTREHDDILPRRGKARGLQLSLRRR